MMLSKRLRHGNDNDGVSETQSQISFISCRHSRKGPSCRDLYLIKVKDQMVSTQKINVFSGLTKEGWGRNRSKQN